jgi:hypothetical protein
MKTAINTKPQAKTIVSALRRELKALDKGTAALSHNDCLAVMAKALGFPSWNAWEATLAEGTDPASKTEAAPATDLPKYPLVNEGQFDFVAPGEDGEAYDGLTFSRLEGTADTMLATAWINSVSRATEEFPADEDGHGNLHVEHAGESKMHWDTQEPQERDGLPIWATESGYEISQARLIIVPASCSEVYDDEDYDAERRLPVREKLVEAYIEYFATHEMDEKAKKGRFDKARKVIGFKLTKAEEKALCLRLSVNAA